MTEIQIHHVMWQPQFQCTLKCTNCYISRSSMSQTDKLDTSILELLDSGEVHCSQFTISLDNSFTPDQKLAEALAKFWERSRALTELCVTARNYGSVQIWARAMNMSVEEFISPIKILTLSAMPSLGKRCLALKELCEQQKTKLYHNKTVTKAMKEEDLGMRYVHQTYLILNKEPLGDLQPPERLRDWGASWKNIREAKNCNIIPDRCPSAALCQNQSCKAGQDMVHIWPDGSVTGCPYDSNNVAGIAADSKETLWKRIQEIQSLPPDHSTKHCKILQKIIHYSNQKVVEKTIHEG